MSRYYRVGPGVWSQPWSDDARLLALYLLTCEHRTVEGLYRLPTAYVAEDMRWDAARVEAAYVELERADFVRRDPLSKVVFIVKALEWQRPANENGVKAALRQLEGLPPTHLLGELFRVAESLCPSLAEGMRALLDQPLPQPLTEPFRNGSSQVENNGSGNSSVTDVDGVGAGDGAGVVEISRARAHEAEALRLASLLADLVRQRDDKAKVAPGSDRWVTAMRLLIADRDGDASEVEQVLRWSQADAFWQSNILSPGKLREKFTQLKVRMASPTSNGKPPSLGEALLRGVPA